jgi:membrane-associated phospholipid phosphatase
MMDIFPSLHTAAPTFLVLYSWRHRHRAPHRYAWPLVAFFALNIIIATMFLRWHYLVDVVVGLALALVGYRAALRITAWETEWRLCRGLGPSWPELGGHRS